MIDPPEVDKNNPWVTQSKKPVYDNPWIGVKEDQVLNPAGKPGIYGTVHFKAVAVGVVPLTSDMQTYLVGQYRYPVEEYSWEIPEGGSPLGTDPLDSAKRELKEETGLVAKHWTRGLDRLWLSNSVCDENAVFFIAQELELGEAEPEDTEDITLWKLPFLQAYEMACRGEIRDILSVLSLIQTKAMLDRGEISQR